MKSDVKDKKLVNEILSHNKFSQSNFGSYMSRDNNIMNYAIVFN